MPVVAQVQLRRNCAMSPCQLASFHATLVAFSFLIGIGFVLYGAWFVLLFAQELRHALANISVPIAGA